MQQLLCCLRDGSIPTAHVDYLDDVPHTDGHFMMSQDVRHSLAISRSVPATCELHAITPILTNDTISSSYRVCNRQALAIDDIISNIRHLESNYISDKSHVCHIIFVECLNAWLSHNHLWYEYWPSPHSSYKYSMPPFIFKLPSDRLIVANAEPKIIRDSDEWNTHSLNDVIGYVYRMVTGFSAAENKSFATTINQTLHMLRFKELNVPHEGSQTKAKLVRCNLSYSDSKVYLLRNTSAAADDYIFWTHLCVEPGIPMFPLSASLGLLLGRLSSVLSIASLSSLRVSLSKHLKQQESKTQDEEQEDPETETDDEKEEQVDGKQKKKKKKKTIKKKKKTNRTKRKREDTSSLTPEEKISHQLKGVYDTEDVFHSTRLRYTCCLSQGVVCSYPISVETTKDSENSPLGVTRLLWDWVKMTDMSSPYVDTDTSRLTSGPRLSMNEPTLTCKTEVVCISDDPERRWFVDDSIGSTLASVFIAPLLDHQDHPYDNNEHTSSVCIIEAWEAFTLLCVTNTDVIVSIQRLFPLLTVDELHQAYRETKCVRLAAFRVPDFVNDCNMPLESLRRVLVGVSRAYLASDHEPLDARVSVQRTTIAENLGFTPILLQQLRNKASICLTSQIQVLDKNRGDIETFTNIHEYLNYCEGILNTGVSWPLARVWRYFHPYITASSANSIQQQESENKIAILSRIQDSILKDVTNRQFSSMIDTILHQQHSDGLSEFNKEMLTVSLMALRHSASIHTQGVSTSSALIKKIELILDTSASHHEHSVKAVLETSRKRIKHMLECRNVVDSNVLIDIGDKLCTTAPNLNPTLTIGKMLIGTARTMEHAKVYPVLLAWRRDRESPLINRDALLDSIAAHIKD